jgi:hypothetical protein
MSGMSISAAIVLALVAITLWVFAGGKGGDQATSTTPAPTAGNTACQTPNAGNCVQSARDLVNGLNAQMSQTTTQPGVATTP